MGCNNRRESSPGPFVGNEEEERDEVEKRMRKRTMRGENEDGPGGSGIEDGRGG